MSKSRIFLRCFNPHTHIGCDLTGKQIKLFRFVSIHAPIQGATNQMHSFRTNREFKSTHPYRVRHISMNNEEQDVKFQSTHPHRVRRVYILKAAEVVRVSIHAPTQGATSLLCPVWFACLVSIHAPTQGATLHFNFVGYHLWFQSTHPHRVRPKNIS